MGNWNPVTTTKPTKSGSYLVVLREENNLGWTHKEPVIAEFGLWTDKPNSWTAFNPESYENEIINNDALWWMELPEVPKSTPINTWIDWHYTPENPFPKLDGDPLVHVRFHGGLTSMDSDVLGVGAQPISYWTGNGLDANNFDWDGRETPINEHDIIAYMILDPNDHD